MGYGLKDEGLGWSSKNFDPNYAFDLAMHAAKNQWGMTEDEISTFMRKIEFHESKEDHTEKQIGGGPGRGIYQYETGANQGGITARNRLARWFKSKMKDIPEWLSQENMDTEGFDASKLTPEQQNMLFLADKRYHPTASLTPEATQDVGKWWAKNHWAGGEEGSDIYNTRVASFNRDLAHNQPVDDVMAGYQKTNLENYIK